VSAEYAFQINTSVLNIILLSPVQESDFGIPEAQAKLEGYRQKVRHSKLPRWLGLYEKRELKGR